MLRTALIVPIAVAMVACSDGSDNGGNTPNQAPTISGLMGQSIEADTPAQTVDFSVSDDATPAANLTVTASSGNEDLVAAGDLSVSGNDANRTLVISPQAGVLGSVNITVRVLDGMGLATEQSIQLSVDRRRVSLNNFVRTVFGTDANAQPLPINTLELAADGTDFNDLL